MSRRSQKLVEYGKPLVLVTEQVPTAPRGGAVVQVAFAGVCHSDIHATEGILQQQNLPLILGHEISGTVANMDPTVKTDVKVGDRVVVYSMGGCSACSRCAEGRPIDCLNRVMNTNGAFIDGGFSDYVVCPDAKLLMKVPDSVAMDTACLLPCSGLTAYNAVATIMPTVNDFARHTDCAVLLVGMGGLGLWAVQIAKQLLPSNVRLVCADVDVDKLASAKDAGCDVTVHWGKEGWYTCHGWHNGKTKGGRHHPADSLCAEEPHARCCGCGECAAAGGSHGSGGKWEGKITTNFPPFPGECMGCHAKAEGWKGQRSSCPEAVKVVKWVAFLEELIM